MEKRSAFHFNQIFVIVQSIKELIKNVFPNISRNYKNHEWLCERAILAPKNKVVDAINNGIQEQIEVRVQITNRLTAL